MILYQNSLMILDYEPSTDILTVDWPNVEEYLLSEVKQTLETLVEHVRNYDVKRLLIDASNTTANPGLIDTMEYKEIVMNFVYGLTQTRLQKSARVIALDKIREEKTQRLTSEIKQEINFSIQNKEFTSKAEAKEWLLAS